MALDNLNHFDFDTFDDDFTSDEATDLLAATVRHLVHLHGYQNVARRLRHLAGECAALEAAVDGAATNVVAFPSAL